MIYPDVSLEEWLTRYPGLQVLQRICPECHRTLETTVPFLTGDYAGLIAPKCPSCNPHRHVLNVTPRSQKEIRAWDQII